MEKTALSLKAVLIEDSVDMDMVNLTAKVVSKEGEVEVIGSMMLKKRHCYIADESCYLKLILWPNHIEKVSLGGVFNIHSKISRSMNAVKKNKDGFLTQQLIVDTLIEENSELAKVENVSGTILCLTLLCSKFKIMLTYNPRAQDSKS